MTRSQHNSLHAFHCKISNCFVTSKFVFIEDGPAVLEKWRKLPAYVVGVATGIAAQKLGLNSMGEDCGNAEKLGKFIVNGNYLSTSF